MCRAGKLYALDSVLELRPRATKSELLKAMEGHVLAEAQLVGLYKRLVNSLSQVK